MSTMKKQISLLLVFVLLTSMLPASVIFADTPPVDVSAVTSAAVNGIAPAELEEFSGTPTKIFATTYANPGNNRNWREGMVSGNGNEGVLTSGAPFQDTFIFQNIYFAMPNGERDSFDREVLYQEMLNARTAVINNDSNGAANALRNWRAFNYAFHPSHQLRMTMEEKQYSDYQRWTDFETAEVGVNYTDDGGAWARKTFTSRADNVTVTEIKQSSEMSKVNMTLSIDNPSSMAGFGAFNSGGIQYKKLVDDNLDYITLVAHYPNLGTDLNEGGFAGLTYVVTVGGTKEKVSLSGSKDSQNVGAEANPGIKIENADAVYLITKSDMTDNMGPIGSFAGMSAYAIEDGLVVDTSAVAEKYGSAGFDYDAALAAHKAIHTTQFNSVKFSLNADESDRALSTTELLAKQKSNRNETNLALMERAYNAGRYVELTTSGYMAPRLCGIWTGDWNAGWRGIYTLDANLNLQVSPMNTSNMKDAPTGYIYFVLRQVKDWMDNAYYSFHMHDALQPPVNYDGNRSLQVETDRAYPFQFWHAGASWLLLPIYEYWQCYGNQQIPLSDTVDLYEIREALGINDGGLSTEEVDAIMAKGYMDLEQDVLLPLLTKQANYWEQLITPEYYMDADGIPHYQAGKTALAEDERYCLIPTYSPENAPRGYTSTITLNATNDISAARDGLMMTVAIEEAVGRTGSEAAIDRWQNLFDKLPEYQYDGEPGSATTATGGGGALREWATQSYIENNNHRHISHLYVAWPAYDTRNDPAMKIAAKQALDNRDRLNTGDSTTGHGYMHRALVAARLNDGETVEDIFNTMLSSDVYYSSMVTDHNTNRGSNTYCTDTSIGMVGATNEALLFSNTGDIEILPSLPPSWTSGSMNGLMARTRAEVQKLEWNVDRGTTNVGILSDIDQTINLTYGRAWESAVVTGDGVSAEITDGEKITLTIAAGAVASIKFIEFDVSKADLSAVINEAEIALAAKLPEVFPAAVEEANAALSAAIKTAKAVYEDETAADDDIRDSLSELKQQLIVFNGAYQFPLAFSLKSGLYTSAQSTKLDAVANDGFEIRYTWDGTEPTKDSALYAGMIGLPVGINNLKAAQFVKTTGERFGDIAEASYMIAQGTNYALGKTVSSSHPVWSSGEGIAAINDGRSNSRWAVRDSSARLATYLAKIDLTEEGDQQGFNTVMLDEYVEPANNEDHRIIDFKLYGSDTDSETVPEDAVLLGEFFSGAEDSHKEKTVDSFMARFEPDGSNNHAYYGLTLPDENEYRYVYLSLYCAVEASVWEWQLYNMSVATDKTELRAAIAEAQACDAALYSPESFSLLEKAVTDAIAVNENESATSFEIATAVAVIKNALVNLVRAAEAVPVVHYDMTLTEDGKLKDVTGNGFDGALTGLSGENIAAGEDGRNYLNFAAGSSQRYVQLPKGIITGEAFSVELYFMPGTNNNEALFTVGANYTNWPACDYARMVVNPNANSGTQWEVLLNNNGGGLTQGTRYAADQLYKVTAVFDNGTLTYYIGGQVWGTVAYNKQIRDIIAANSTDTLIGYLGRSAWNGDPFFSGKLAGFKVFDFALSPGEIEYSINKEEALLKLKNYVKASAFEDPSGYTPESYVVYSESIENAAAVVAANAEKTLDEINQAYDILFAAVEGLVEKGIWLHYDMETYEGALLTDVSGSGNDGTLVNLDDSRFVADPVSGRPIIEFGADNAGINGSSGNARYIKLPMGSIPGEDFTIETYFKREGTGSANQAFLTLGAASADASGITYARLHPFTTAGAQWEILLNNSGGNVRYNDPAIDSTERYSKVTAVFKSTGIMDYYVDGAFVGSVEHGSDIQAILTRAASAAENCVGYIGRPAWRGDQNYGGYLADFKVYNYALSSEEIAAASRNLAAINDAFKTAEEILASADDYKQNAQWTAFISALDDVEAVKYDPESVSQDEIDLAAAALSAAIENLESSDELTDAEKVALAKERLALSSGTADNPIKGNITLPETGLYDTVIHWNSSDVAIISDTDKAVADYDDMPAGVVTRQTEDMAVTLTATIQLGEVIDTKAFAVTVKAKPAEKELTDYLFAYFPSDSEEQIYFAAGEDPLHFTDINNGTPVLTSDIGDQGVRDPYVFRSAEGDHFYMIATDLKVQTTGWGKAQYDGSLNLVIWESDDLVNWSEPRLADVGMTAYENIGCVWAPEAIYDEKTGEYVVFWASMTGPEDGQNTHQIVYYSKTRDFINFTEAKLFIDTGAHCIDTSMVKAGDKYYRVSAAGEIIIDTSDSVLGEWTRLSTLKSLSRGMNGWDEFYAEFRNELTGGIVEGPELFKFNNEDVWGLYSDNYGGWGYIPVTTTDLSDTTGEAWTIYTRDEYNFGSRRKRHGSILGITAEEYEAVKQIGQVVEPNPELIGKVSADPDTFVTTFTEKLEEEKIINLYISRNNSKSDDLTDVALVFELRPGAVVVNQAASYDLTKSQAIQISYTGQGGQEIIENWTIKGVLSNNPVLPGQFADPDIDIFNGKYYIYPTTDGVEGWGGYQFHVFSSDDLITWEDEGLILDLRAAEPYENSNGVEVGVVPWATGNAWAPTIEEKDGKYYFYFSGHDPISNAKAVGVAVSDSPTGPFVAKATPLLTITEARNQGISMGQVIDPSIFTEDDGTSYMLFGNGNPAIVELGDDMMSWVPGSMRNYSGATGFREAISVTKIDGVYHFTWSQDDTGSENYCVQYGTSDNLYGPITYRYKILEKYNSLDIKGTGHHSVLYNEATNEYFIVYHRFWTPLGQVTSGFGFHRETCIDKLPYSDGLFQIVTPTLTGITEPVYTLSDDTVFSLDKLIGGEALSATTGFTNASEETVTGNVILAVYNEKGILVQIACEAFDSDASEAVSIETEVVLPEDVDGYSVKVFLWDDNYMPLRAAKLFVER